VTATIKVGNDPEGIAVSGNLIWVAVQAPYGFRQTASRSSEGLRTTQPVRLDTSVSALSYA